MGPPIPAGNREAGEPDPSDAVLERALRSWRIALARQQGVPPYVILYDTTLQAIVAARPRTFGDLLSVPAIGRVKAERYGPAILALIPGRR